MYGKAARSIVVIGGGPAGLMAAQACASAGATVDLYDAMPSVGRKFLLAGKGGLNLTHSESEAAFRSRFAGAQAHLGPSLEGFGPDAVREWARDLGIETFVGTSGRVFPREMKAAPLLRAWLHRLRRAGVRFHSRHRWVGWGDAADGGEQQPPSLRLVTVSTRGSDNLLTGNGNLLPDDPIVIAPDAVILALGGGSWPQLGSDGTWTTLLAERGVPVVALKPANCGFDCGWSRHFADRFAGAPIKSVAVLLEPLDTTDATSVADREDVPPRRGEFIVTETGVEGSLIYACAAAARDRIEANGDALLLIDLVPDRSLDWLRAKLAQPSGGRSLSNRLHRIGIDGVKAGLLRECLPAAYLHDPERLASGIKRLPLRLLAPRPLREVISTAGGVPFEALDDRLMLRALPGVFCAGEMLDWEAPTGGYLLTACLATGRQAGNGAMAWLSRVSR